MSDLAGVLVAIAATVTAVTVIAGAVWWLIWPRIEDKFEQVARGIRAVERQTSSDDPDTLSRHARVAASAAADIIEVHDQLKAHLEEVVTWRSDLEEWRTNTDRRLTVVEESLLALLIERRKRPTSTRDSTNDHSGS